MSQQSIAMAPQAGSTLPVEAVFQHGEPLSRADVHHLHSRRRPTIVRHAGELQENRARDRASLLTELILGRIFVGKWPILASAYISGISVGILVRSPAFWPYAVCAIVSIMSKYVLRVKGRHIWNPSNFGISVLLFLAPETVAALSIQWGNYLLPMLVIWILGSVIIARLHRFNITATYVACFIVFAFPAQLHHRQPVAVRNCSADGSHVSALHFFHDYRSEDDGPVKVLAMRRCRDRCLVEMILRLSHVVYAPFYALFLVGPAALLIEMWFDSRRTVPARVAA